MANPGGINYGASIHWIGAPRAEMTAPGPADATHG